MKQGDRVRISFAAGVVYGRVDDIRKTDELLDLPGFNAGPVEIILAEMEVSRVALFSHTYGRQRLLFAALYCGGEWIDMHGQVLKIECLGPREQWIPPSGQRERQA